MLGLATASQERRVDPGMWTLGAARAALCPISLIVQPIVFFRHVLINPSAHIPYDIEGFHLPLIAYIAQCVRQGIAPFWDPYSFTGAPIHADLQAQLFYPFNQLAILLGNLSQGHNLFYWVEVLVPLHMALAGLFTFLLLRRMGASRPASLMGASIYQLGGFFASQAQHLCAISTAPWLPLAVLAVFELRQRFRPRWVAILALSVALSILSGFAATTLVAAGAVALVAAGWVATREASWRMLPGLAAGCLAGAGVAAIELVPLWTLTHLSVAAERARWHTLGGGLPLQCLVSLVTPDYYHIFEFGSLYKLPYNFTFLYAYCGIAALILIVFAPFVRQRRAILFFALTAISAVWMVGENTPAYRTLYLHLPYILRGALYSEYALMAFTFFAGITAAVTLDRVGGRLPRVLLWAIALLTVYDLIHTGADRPMNTDRGGYKTGDLSYRVQEEAVATRIRSLAGKSQPPARVDYTDRQFYEGFLAPGMLGIPTTSADNPFQLLRVMHVRWLYATGVPWDRGLVVNRVGSPLLNMLNVSLLAGASPISANQADSAGLEALPPDQGMYLYRNPHALPRFFLVPRTQRSAGEAETLRLLAQPSFNPADEAIVEGMPNDQHGLATGDVRVRFYGPNRVELSVAVDRPAFLVTSEAMYPGWEATVNGAPRPLWMTNGAFRGLSLPAGKSRIEMRYRPVHLLLFAWLSVIAGLTVIVVALVSERPRGLARQGIAQAFGVWLALARLAARCRIETVRRKRAILSVGLILLIVFLFYWKIVLTSQFSILTRAGAVNQSYSGLQLCVFSLRHGTIPLWDPYMHGGRPVEGGIGPWNPLHLLPALAPLGHTGLVTSRVYHLWFAFLHFLAACSMFALAREFGLGRCPALVAGLCFSLSGLLGSTGVVGILETGIWLPLVALFLLRALSAEDRGHCIMNASLSGTAFGLSILAGSTDIAIMAALILVSLGAVASRSLRCSARAVATAMATGLAMGSPQWLPVVGSGWGNIDLSHPGFPPPGIVTLLIPGSSAGLGLYLGVFPLLLAVVAIWRNWRNAWARYLAVVALAAFLLALGDASLFHGILSFVLSKLWVGDASQFLFLVSFSGALLAGFGAATLLSEPSEAGSEKSWSSLNRVLLSALALCAAGLLWTSVVSGAEATAVIALPVTLIFLSYGLFQYLLRKPAGRWTSALVLGMILFDWNASDRLPQYRREVASSQANEWERLLSFRGAAQFLKARRFEEPFRVQLSGEGLRLGDVFGIETVDAGESAPERANVRYRVAPASAGDPAAVYQDAFWKIYRMDSYPRMWVVHGAEFARTREEQLARLAAPGFDLWKTAAMDARINLAPPVSSGDPTGYFNSQGNHVEADVHLSSRGLLVVSQKYDAGWHAIVNGSEAPVHRVNADMCGIVLDRGDARVVFEYRPAGLGFALVLALSAFLWTLRVTIRPAARP